MEINLTTKIKNEMKIKVFALIVNVEVYKNIN